MQVKIWDPSLRGSELKATLKGHTRYLQNVPPPLSLSLCISFFLVCALYMCVCVLTYGMGWDGMVDLPCMQMQKHSWVVNLFNLKNRLVRCLLIKGFEG